MIETIKQNIETLSDEDEQEILEWLIERKTSKIGWGDQSIGAGGNFVHIHAQNVFNIQGGHLDKVIRAVADVIEVEKPFDNGSKPEP